MTCGYKWRAPFVVDEPQNHKIEMREQTCILEKDHEEAHESGTKVTTPNIKK